MKQWIRETYIYLLNKKFEITVNNLIVSKNNRVFIDGPTPTFEDDLRIQNYINKQ